MRWHVHGTDAVTGEDLELSVNDYQREHAIKAAMDRRILVSHVTAGTSRSWRKVLTPLAVLTILGLAVAAGGLYAQNRRLGLMLDETVAEQSRMASSLATAERSAAEIRAKGNLGEDAEARMKKLAEDLAAARTQKSLTEMQLSVKDQHITELEPAALRLPEVEAQVATLTQQLTAAKALLGESERLRDRQVSENGLLAKRIEELERLPTELAASSNAAIDKLNAANAELASELEKLKGELLVAVAKAHAATQAAEAQAEAMPEPAPPAPWALRVSYDNAQKFLALHTDPATVTTRAGAGGGAGESAALFTSGGVLTENALRLRFVHDKDKEQVYSSTIIVPPTADAPKDKAEENNSLITAFIREFIPDAQDADSVVASAMKQAPSLSESQRALFLVQDCKVTVWRTAAGLVTFQIDTGADLVEQ